MRSLLRELARRFCLLHGKLEANLPLTRLVEHILAHARVVPSEGETAVLYATQEDIAEAIGVTRETVNKYLGDLQARGLLRVARGIVRVLDGRELRRVGGE
jgi:CRP-like cAMP-binding protein